MPVTARSGALVLVTAVVAGCAGGNDEPAPLFTQADATRIASVRPVTPGWPPWPEIAVRTDTPEGPEFASKWKDGDKLANLVAQIYESDSSAHAGIERFNALSRGYGEKYGFITKDEGVNGLGDEAWRLWVGGSGTEVTYHWRRGNLVVEAHVHCYGDCPSDVDAAARAWADAIDEEARGES